ncbi:MAG: outer membrane protein transport protein [Treponema sp.]|nr:outer membrane protein transport protein [Treponema sp.]
MKRTFAFAAAAMSVAFAFAGGVENKTNMSTGYLRNPSRNAEFQRPEAAFYNIAGTAFMNDGLWIEAGNQFVFKEYKHELTEGQLLPVFSGAQIDTAGSDKTTVWLYPDFDAVYHKGDFSVFMNFGVYAGGGSLNFDDGSSLISAKFIEAGMKQGSATALAGAAKNHTLKVDSITYGGEVGGAYKFLDGMVSVGAAFRMVYGTQSMELTSDDATFKGLNGGGDTVSYDAKATGFGGVFGVHARPIDKLDLSVQYSTINKIKYKVDNVEGNLASEFKITDGKKFNNDLPATLSFGASYSVIDPLLVSFSCNYYFNKQSSMDSVLGENDYDNSIEFALGADYKINDMIGASLGFSYSKQGTNDESNSPFAPVLDSFAIGGGVEVTPIENLTLTAAGMWVNYFDVEGYRDMFKLSKDLVMASIGVTYRLPF